MQGNLLESTGLGQYIALGKRGHPVFDSAEQILASLQRYPDLKNFFAIPQKNQNGSSVDWYSPVPGNVIVWARASDEEKEAARAQLQNFVQKVQARAQEWIELQRPEAIQFGELLQEACKVPSTDHIYLIQISNSKRIAASKDNHTSAELTQDSSDYKIASNHNLQPVLCLWGFLANEGDRHYNPLYFLEKQKIKKLAITELLESPITATPAKSGLLITPSESPVVILDSKSPIINSMTVPWWKRWWWLFLLLLLLLLLLGLLRACNPIAPHIGLSNIGSTSQTPQNEVIIPGTQAPNTNSAINGSIPEIERQVTAPPMHTGNTELGLGDQPTMSTEGNTANTATQSAGEDGQEETLPPQSENQLPTLLESASEPQVESPVAMEATSKAEPDSQQQKMQPQPLTIPQNLKNGVANFLDGQYRTQGGLMDEQEAKPLNLEYDFKDGKGEVKINRPNGVTCKGHVLASITNGILGIQSQNSAQCSDGTQYDMPKINCEPNASSIADCSASYGSNSFPIEMHSKSN